MTILDKIITNKIKEVEEARKEISLDQLKDSELYYRTPVSIKKNLLASDKPGIIAEHKRKSPSKGIINNNASLSDVVLGYQNAGVQAVSILTDFNYFMGKKEDVTEARKLLNIPILRKEFMIDTYQVHEAKAIGADFILLIAACLSKMQADELAGTAKELGMDVLVEIHTEQEMENVPENADLVGVNNRNLKTFDVDINTSIELAKVIPDHFVKISESGISNIESIKKLWQHGYKGFLIGENFMKTASPGNSCMEFTKALYQ